MSVVDQEDMMGQYPWVVYVILAEIFTRIIPSFLLVILNTKMIFGYSKDNRYLLAIHDDTKAKNSATI